MVQEAWFGKGKFLLNKFRRSVSFLQNQEILLPNKRDGISVIAFYSPAMCKGVNGDAPAFLNRIVSAITSYISTNEPLSERRFIHPIVGELLQKNVIYDARNYGQTSYITSHNINNPAISKSEFVMLLLRNNSFKSSGQASQNNVGMHAFTLPIMMPPISWIYASLNPM